MRWHDLLSGGALSAGLPTVTALVLLSGAPLGYAIHRLRCELEARDGAWNDHLSHSALMARLEDVFGERASRLARMELVWRVIFILCLSAIVADLIWRNWR